MLPKIPDNYSTCRFFVYCDSPSDTLLAACHELEGKTSKFENGKDHWLGFHGKIPSGQWALSLSFSREANTTGEDATDLISEFANCRGPGLISATIKPTYPLKDIPPNGFIKSLAGIRQSMDGMSFDLVGAYFSVKGENVSGGNVSDFSWTTDSDIVSAEIKWWKPLANIPGDVFNHAFLEADKTAQFLVLNEKIVK